MLLLELRNHVFLRGSDEVKPFMEYRLELEASCHRRQREEALFSHINDSPFFSHMYIKAIKDY